MLWFIYIFIEFYICFKTEGCGLGKFPKIIIKKKTDLINFIKYMCGKVHFKYYINL